MSGKSSAKRKARQAEAAVKAQKAELERLRKEMDVEKRMMLEREQARRRRGGGGSLLSGARAMPEAGIGGSGTSLGSTGSLGGTNV
jgi:hypothetical protein